MSFLNLSVIVHRHETKEKTGKWPGAFPTKRQKEKPPAWDGFSGKCSKKIGAWKLKERDVRPCVVTSFISLASVSDETKAHSLRCASFPHRLTILWGPRLLRSEGPKGKKKSHPHGMAFPISAVKRSALAELRSLESINVLFGTFLRFAPKNSLNQRFSDVFTQRINVARLTTKYVFVSYLFLADNITGLSTAIGK